jgi:hypothetical protein
MGVPLLLVGFLFPVSQPSERAGWVVTPRLRRGHELVYRGIYRELMPAKRMSDQRSYLMEVRVFVLDTSARGLDVAFFTVLRPNVPDTPADQEAEAVSVRLERALLDRQGQLHSQAGVCLAAPVDTPPFVECGAFVDAPAKSLAPKETWRAVEPGRPPINWRVVGLEMLAGFPCLHLEAVQMTPTWGRLGNAAVDWQRRETVWLSTDLGVARRVERVIERRVLAYREPECKVISYERQSVTEYPGQLFEDRRREILEAGAFRAALAPCLSDPGRYAPEVYDGLLARIAQHLERRPSTPYRGAILQVKHQVEAARRGETPPALRP